ncbi:hypothetical protein CC1G_03926 [Coprinopsis cinerea okayama7|uniref:Hamartin n=1 Tax=Coprinopsis cinerea (strain Okayama-7 / 130 / ATCC MYA-4618 / FGSC 9003) TaxID=240176 RepID=A8NH84_COPC7|nr:hypothetical protein CC1G_03926 [Coprinopsis cinerea okayama7\|eukprot:XP_001833709.2 hypothetical protein CC1G_03926 [Coprinopsis cinerea okayama7\
MVNLIRTLRLVLDKVDTPTLSEVLENVDEFVLECTQSEEPEVQLFKFEEELQSLHHEVTDYSSTYHTEVFLAVLFHLGPILPPTSVISWFDLVLRPALREPKLPTASLNHAKELIISALQKTHEAYAVRVHDFRRRLLELYLLDAYNEGSGDDALEWAELNQEEQARRTRWKHNLQDILIAYGGQSPEDLLTEIDRQFAIPSHRLQLLILLNKMFSANEFPPCTPVVASHSILKSLWNCLLFDNSSTVCTAALSLVSQLLPYFAVHTKEILKSGLPQLFAIMARVVCWKERPPPLRGEGNDEEFERELYRETVRVLQPRPELGWERLEMTFRGTPSVPPSFRPYFTILFYLYPSNTLKFIRWPVQYMKDAGYPSPYTVPWEEALDEDGIRRKSENLMREHICHPCLIWNDPVTELEKPEFWSRYDVPRIGSEATMLDIRYLAMGLREKYAEQHSDGPPGAPGTTSFTHPVSSSENPESTHFIHPVDLSSGKVKISLQDMIDASVALKSNIDVEVTKPYAKWSSLIFPSPVGRITSSMKGKSPETTSLRSEDTTRTDDGSRSMVHVAEVISGLQKEVLLLRNELNFELWHSRENAKHVGRLYEDRILMRSAESERQGLYNKLRKYRNQVKALETELHEHKTQTAAAKSRYADWTKELQDKLKILREDKKKLVAEANAVRSSELNLKALFDAQGKRLSEALGQVFTLQAEAKQNTEQIERLRDCEKQVEELTKLRQTWEDDSRTFADVKREMERLQQRNSELEERVRVLEAERSQQLAQDGNDYKRQIQSLELRLAQMEELADPGVVNASKRLSDENSALKNEIEELQAIVLSLKEQRNST